MMRAVAAGDRLAVYGSLRSDAENRLPSLGVLNGLQCIGPAWMAGQLLDLGQWPGLIDGDSRIRCELYRIMDPHVMPILDAFEDYFPDAESGSIYLRRWCSLLAPDEGEAWVYRYQGPRDGAIDIAGGDWLAHRARRAAQEEMK